MSDGYQSYRDAKKMADLGIPARTLIMAAMLTDDDLVQRLVDVYPTLHAETMRRRWDSEDGMLPGDRQDQPSDEDDKIQFLGRD